MAHDSRCENANTSPADCNCDCGGSKHGLGYVEDEIHELETDIPEIEQLKQMTPDEYFGEQGINAIEEARTRLYSKFKEADEEDRERLERDIDRVEKMVNTDGLEFVSDLDENHNLKFFLKKQTKKYDYDLTDIGSAKKFRDLLDRHGLTEFKRVKQNESDEDPIYDFTWYNPEKDLAISTSNNPVTGKYQKPFSRSDERGYASYVAIAGENDNEVEKLDKDFVETAEHIKDGGEEAGYSSITAPSSNKIGLFSP
jgi:hypothetical protein